MSEHENGPIEDTRVDLGHGVFYSKCLWHGEWVAIHEWHQCDARDVPGVYGDGTTAGWIPFNIPAADEVTTGLGPRWEVIEFEPLTLSPSLQCALCSHHGFIRADRWVPA